MLSCLAFVCHSLMTNRFFLADIHVVMAFRYGILEIACRFPVCNLNSSLEGSAACYARGAASLNGSRPTAETNPEVVGDPTNVCFGSCCSALVLHPTLSMRLKM
ncbi:hypothetical protein V8C44DRAFT_335539 [Trichoderma aethiopicum]